MMLMHLFAAIEYQNNLHGTYIQLNDERIITSSNESAKGAADYY
jgi:hypothetical protein